MTLMQASKFFRGEEHSSLRDWILTVTAQRLL